MWKITIIGLFVAICGAQAAAEVKGVNLGNTIKAIAIDSSRGEAAVIFAADDNVTLYPHLSASALIDAPVVRPVGKDPENIVFKRARDRAYFLVLCSDDHSLYVLAPATLEVVKRIELPANVHALGAPLDPEAPFAYYAQGLRIGRVDLTALADQGLAPETLANTGVPPFGDPPPLTELCPSADGRYLYIRRESASGVWIVEVLPDADKPHIRQKQTFQLSTLDLRADPFGSGVVLDRETADPHRAAAMEPLASLPLKQSCFLTARPVVLNLDGSTLLAYSYNTTKEIASLTVEQTPAGGSGRLLPSMPNGATWLPQVPMACDEKNQTAVVCRGRHVTVFALADLKLPNEPLLSVNVPASPTAAVDRDAVIKLKCGNAKASVELVAPPVGMRMVGDTIHWTPTENDLGMTPVRVRVSADGVSHEQTFSIRVTRFGIELPFDAEELVLSPDGKLAVALAPIAVPVLQNGQPPLPGAASGSTMVLVDLDHDKILAQRQLPKAVRLPVILGDHVFAAGTGSDVIYRYSCKDLSDEDKSPQEGHIVNMAGAGDRLILVIGDGNVMELSAGTLKPRGEKYTANFFTGLKFVAPVRCPEGWMYRGVLFDPSFEKVLSVVSPEVFPAIPFFKGMPPMTAMGVEQWPQTAYPWGMLLQGNQIQRPPSHGSIGQPPGQPAAVLSSIPAVVGLSEVRTPNTNRTRIVLQIADLVTVTRQAEIVMTSDADDEPRLSYREGRRRFWDAGGCLVVQMGNFLFPVDLNKAHLDKLPQPPRIVPGALPQVTADKPTIVTLGTRAMKGAIRFSLESNLPGESIDEATGKITIDGPKIYPLALEAALAATAKDQRYSVFPPHEGIKNSADLLQAVRKDLGHFYYALFNVEPSGIPVLLPLRVRAQDEDQQTASLDFSIIVMVDAQAFAEKLVPPRFVFLPRSDQHPNPMSAVVPNPQNQQVADLMRQVSELQKENADLKAQVNVLKDLITHSQQSKKPDP